MTEQQYRLSVAFHTSCLRAATKGEGISLRGNSAGHTHIVCDIGAGVRVTKGLRHTADSLARAILGIPWQGPLPEGAVLIANREITISI